MKIKLNNLFLILAIVSLTVFVSCGNGNSEVNIPENILSKEEYTKLLLDFALAESAINLNVKNIKIEKIDSTYAFDPLKENHVSRSRYDSSALFYSEHPEVYKEIYDNVLQRLSEMESKRKHVVKDSAKK